MRYEVGKEYLFINVDFTPAAPRLSALYMPWADTLNGINVLTLKCVEHHKVCWDQDPNGVPEYDGFVFTDGDGTIYHNQYPYASYGQIDDSADRHVKPALPVQEFKGLPKAEQDKLIWFRATDTRTLIETAYNALNGKDCWFNDDQKASFQTYMAALIEAVNFAGYAVEFKPMRLELKDGTRMEITGRYSASITRNS